MRKGVPWMVILLMIGAVAVIIRNPHRDGGELLVPKQRPALGSYSIIAEKLPGTLLGDIQQALITDNEPAPIRIAQAPKHESKPTPKPAKPSPRKAIQLRPNEISGRTMDGNGDPLDGVQITLNGYGKSKSFFSKTSDDKGYYVVEVEPDHIYEINFYRREHTDGKLTDISAGQSNVDMTQYRLGHVSGTVVGPNGHPIPDFNIAMATDPFSGTPETFRRFVSRNGTFRFENVLPDEEYFIYVYVEGLASTMMPVTMLPPGQSLEDVVIQLDTSHRLKGRVVDVRGEPLVGATIILGHLTPNRFHFQKEPYTTDGDGRFQINNLQSGRITVRAAKDTYIHALKETEITDAETEIELELGDGAVITGKVTNKGLPVSDVPVYVTIPTLTHTSSRPRIAEHNKYEDESYSALTDANGRYVITGVYEGPVLVGPDIQQQQDGYNMIHKKIDAVDKFESVVDFHFGTSTGIIVGTVMNTKHASGPGRITMWMSTDAGEIDRETYTDARGNYAFLDVPPGNFRIRVASRSTNISKNTAGVLGENEKIRFDIHLAEGSTVRVPTSHKARSSDYEILIMQGSDLPPEWITKDAYSELHTRALDKFFLKPGQRSVGKLGSGTYVAVLTTGKHGQKYDGRENMYRTQSKTFTITDEPIFKLEFEF